MSIFPNRTTFLQIGSLSIQWYAVFIITGACITYAIAQRNFKKMGYSLEILSDFFFSVLIVGIIGARIWYVIFMYEELYQDNLIEIIMFRHGGLAIQGGVIAGLLYGWWFFKRKNIDFLVAGDAIMPAVLIAQAIGRWGNFVNQEAYGSVVSLEFLKGLHLPGFIIDGMNINGAYYHPTFLYESIANIIGFLLIYFVIRRFQDKQGYQFYSYFVWYGVTRFFIEGLRTDSLYIMGLRTAQLTSIAFVIIGVVGILWCKMKGKPVVETVEK